MTPPPAGLWRLGALEMAAAFRSGAADPVAALNACLAQLDRLDPQLHVMIARNPGALEQAQASALRYREGRITSLLDGVPIAVKDNILTQDQPTSWGNPCLAERRGWVDEIAVARLRAAGLVIIGKTSVPEFTLEGFTANPLVGVTGNPWQSESTPGGSSGGSVAGVAAGCFPLAIGTDGGGSIRRPAAYTGLVGLKPSIGAIPRVHTLPSLLLDFEVIGPLARDVADLRALYAILSGPHDLDRASQAQGQPPFESSSSLRVLAVQKMQAHPVDPVITRSWQQMSERLASLGHIVTVADLPLNLDDINAVWPTIGRMGLALIAQRDPAVIAAASPAYQAMAREGAKLSGADCLAVIETAASLRREVAELFGQFDVILMPACAAMPWPAGEAFPPLIDGQSVGARGHAVFTGWVNAAGVPAVSVPAMPADNGLPIGMQLIGPWAAEAALLDLAGALEAIQPWVHRWPAIADEH